MAAGDGLPDLVTPYNTSEFEALVHAVRSHFNAMAGQAQVVGADLRRLLPQARGAAGRQGLFGLDLQVAAWQVAKQFAQLAASSTAGAAAAGRALEIYHGSFTAGTGPRGSTFDASK